MSKKKVFCILGPTASGKTNLAIELVQQLPCDIISVDSALVYKGMDIGTAKPTQEEQLKAPHRLIDICDPADNYSAGQFCLDAHREIDDILKHDRIPLLVGGTMLYFNLLNKGFSEFPGADPAIRLKLDELAKQEGWPAMHKRLQVIDPISASTIHSNDTQRIQRALELYEMTGKPMSVLQQEQHWQDLPFEIVNIILTPMDRALVHQRIEQRFDLMLKQGFIEEVEGLYQRDDLTASLPSIRMVGYRQAWSYLAGEYDRTEMRERAIIATRQFAKRQFTWLRRWEDAQRFDSADPELVQKVVRIIIGLL